MNRFYFILAFSILFPVFGVQGQIIEYSGRILDEDFYPLYGAMVRISGTGLATSANEEGHFFLPVQKGDTLIISHLGYLPALQAITQADSNNRAFGITTLKKTVYELQTVDIFPWPETYQEFKQAFVQLQLEEEKMAELNIPGIPKSIPQLSDDRYGVAVGGPVQLVYNLFSKEVKRRKRFFENIKREKYYDRISLKYNRELVSRISGLKDPLQIDRFMKYCALDEQFILRSSDYDIYFAILSCWRSWPENENTDSIPDIR